MRLDMVLVRVLIKCMFIRVITKLKTCHIGGFLNYKSNSPQFIRGIESHSVIQQKLSIELLLHESG
jgi:hypothetical protein